MTFLDEIIDRASQGKLPSRKVPERYEDSEWNIVHTP
jgi:hypothetical protein